MSRALGPRADAAVPLESYAQSAAVPFVRVADLLQALRRRWRLWLTTALGGLMVALALSLAFPPPHAATTVLLLHHPADVDPTRAMKTDSELLKTRTVAQGAIDRLGLDLTPAELISDYSATALSDLLLQVTAYGSTAEEAVRMAEALASEFLRFRREEFERQSQVVVRVLEERKGTLSAESEVLTARIDSFGRGQNVSDLSDLLARRTAVATELAELGRRIDEMRIDAVAVSANSRVVDPVGEPKRSPLKAMAANVLAGIVGGLALGMGWVVISEVASDRVRRRQEVMLSLRAPVAVSIGPLRGPLWVQRTRFRRHLAKSSRPDIIQVVRHLRSVLSTDGALRPALVTVSVASDGPAALFVASTAVELLREGKNVLVVDLSRRSALAAVLEVPAGKTAPVAVEGTESRLWLTFPSAELEDAHEDDELGMEPDVALVLATLDPALGAWHLLEWARTAVTVATAGRSTATALRSAAQMIRGAGLELTSAILVAADPSDESLGIPDSSTGDYRHEGPRVPVSP